jgi:uncharacterized protein (TIGR03083 family)
MLIGAALPRPARGGYRARIAELEISEYIAAVGREGRRLVDDARAAGLDAPVPSCPDWVVRDLVRHMGGVHHWAATHVRDRLTEDVDDELEDQVGGWPPDGQLLGWAAAQVATLVEVFEAADPDFPYFTWFRGTTPFTMWTRRQAHETAIHRVDAELAAGEVTPFDAAFAADGVDELVLDMVGRRDKPVDVDEPLTLHLQATDIDRAWTIELAPERLRGFAAPRGEPDGTVTGTASELYLAMWHRVDAVDREGDPRALDVWWSAVAPRWS